MIFKKIKSSFRHCMRYFGYDIIKVTRTPFMRNEFVIKVGVFNLTLPIQNPLIKTYLEQPDFAAEIGRLVNSVYSKYPNLTFLDAGANTGDTIAIVKSAKDIPVISIEGDAFSFSYLERNTAQFNKVKIINTFLSDKNEILSVDLEKKGWNTTVVPKIDSTEKIETKTIDTILNGIDHSVQNIKIFKIDTEGFDPKIIRGALDYIKTIKPVIYFEYNRENMSAIGELGIDTLLLLRDIGYGQVLFYDDKGRYILHSDFSNLQTIKDMHDYADGKNGLIYYYNICLFHKDDSDLASRHISSEAEFRNQAQ